MFSSIHMFFFRFNTIIYLISLNNFNLFDSFQDSFSRYYFLPFAILGCFCCQFIVFLNVGILNIKQKKVVPQLLMYIIVKLVIIIYHQLTTCKIMWHQNCEIHKYGRDYGWKKTSNCSAESLVWDKRPGGSRLVKCVVLFLS